MLDRDLDALYGVETKALKQVVKRTPKWPEKIGRRPIHQTNRLNDFGNEREIVYE